MILFVIPHFNDFIACITYVRTTVVLQCSWMDIQTKLSQNKINFPLGNILGKVSFILGAIFGGFGQKISNPSI